MIISRTPFRVSFFGGGSDLPAYYNRQKGAVMSTTIDKYMYISAHPFFNRQQISLKYSITEIVDSVEDIAHPLVRECLKMLSIDGGMEITSTADVPAGTGLGSSSSFTVGLLNTLYSFKGKFVSNERLARDACDIEILKVGDPIGKQDQYAASFGGLNVIEFAPDETVEVTPVNLKSKTIRSLEENLVMYYTKTSRSAKQILVDQAKRLGEKDRFQIQEKMVDLVYEARDLLYGNDLASFGELLDKTWQMKKKLSEKITDSSIDKHYETAMKNGALGGKLLGAGGGGFLLFYCEPEKQEKLRESLKGLYELKFSFDWAGSKIIYVGDKNWGDENGFFE
ncbi:GHMP kinase [Candidatus Altiarchaeota archaeon]